MSAFVLVILRQHFPDLCFALKVFSIDCGVFSFGVAPRFHKNNIIVADIWPGIVLILSLSPRFRIDEKVLKIKVPLITKQLKFLV